MTVMIEPGLLAGAVTPPSSKSQAHRLLIARALAGENLDDPAHPGGFPGYPGHPGLPEEPAGRGGEAPGAGVRRVGLHTAVPDPGGAGPAGRRRVSGTGEADGPAPGALLPDL